MKLTDEQIAELAPEWATHYLDMGYYTLFESEHFIVLFNKKTRSFCGEQKQWGTGVSNHSKPIPRKSKQFDITQYEWSDDKLSLLIGERDLISINDNCSNSCFDLFRDDAIAIAKHFGLTAEDLK